MLSSRSGKITLASPASAGSYVAEIPDEVDGMRIVVRSGVGYELQALA